MMSVVFFCYLLYSTTYPRSNRLLKGTGLSEFQHVFKGQCVLEGFAELDISPVHYCLLCFYYPF